MFSNLNKPAFGTGTTNTSFGFGSSTAANPFGGQNQLFGKPAGSTFGTATPAFGQTAGSSLFPGNQPQTGGLFQSSTPSFGAPATGQTAFGSPATTQPAFGSNVFGTTSQQAPGGGLFGSSAFGQQNKPGGFGFGATAGQPSLFGQTQPTAQQTASPFQASTSSTLFGGGGGAFGATQQSGTVIKFQPITSTDTMQKSGVTQTINTKHHCITCMKEYEGKSLEELRWEDYQANRKGPQQPGFGATPFSSVSSAVPIFGQQQENKPVFGQTTGGFGSSFGIGAQTSTSQNIFGKPGGFGTTTTTASAFGFGTNTLSSSPFSKPFGTPTTQPLFGAGTQQTSTFGGGMFSQPQNTGLFGKPQTSTAFGTGTPSFSFSAQPASQTTSLFSTTKPNTTFPAFGQTNTTTPVFGQQQSAFGQTAQPAFGASTFGKPATGGFGQPAQPAFGTGLGMQQGSLFSGLSKPTGNLFSSSTGTCSFFSNNTMQPQTSLMAPQQQPQPLQLPSEKQNEDFKMALNISDQFGQLIQLSRIKPEDTTKKTEMSRITKPDDIEKLLVRPTSPPTTNPMKSKIVTSSFRKPSIFDGLGEEMSVSSASLLKPRKRLVLKNKDKENTPPASALFIGEEQPQTNGQIVEMNNKLAPTIKASKQLEFSFNSEKDTERSLLLTNSVQETESQITQPTSLTNKKLLLLAPDDVDVTASASTSTLTSDEFDTPRSDMTDPNPIIILKRPQYYTIPPLPMLEKLKDEDGKCYIKGFTIGRVGYGNVCFPEMMDVSNLNLDEIVHIRHREVLLYPDDAKKPPIGQGLNRRAQVTFDAVYPVVNGQTIKNPDGTLVTYFTENLREVCDRKGMRFLEYRPETGSFVFEVDHFSKYGLDNEDISVDTNKYRNRKMEEMQKDCERPKEGIEAEIDGISTDNGYGDDDVINGLGGISIPDIEMTDIITSSSDSKDHSECETSRERTITDDYLSSMSSIFDLSSNNYLNRAKEVHLIKSALYFDNITELERNLGAAMKTVATTTGTSPHQFITPVKISTRKPIIDVTALQPEIFEVKAFYDLPFVPPVSLMDLAIFKGKSAKIGWVKGTTFTKPIWKFDNHSYFTLTDIMTTPFKLQLASIELPTVTINSVEFIENSLKIFQEECDCTIDGDIPLFHLTYPHKFIKQQIGLASALAVHNRSKESLYFRNVWSLCWALFGPMRNSQSNKMVYFNKWLKEVVSATVEENQHSLKNPSKDEILEEIYINLTGRRIEKAARLALKFKFPQLSLLITSFSVLNVKELLTVQINDWKKSGTIKYMNKKLVKIYMLLAGMPVCGQINICDNLEWLRAFAVHVWYVGLYAQPLGTAVELYEKAFKDLGYAPMPFPVHYKGDLDNPPFDLFYQLILLFTRKNIILNAVLNPAGYTSNMTDYRLSWFLLEVFTSLKIGTISEHARNYICTSFANQLEQLNLWQYSIFVVLFIKDNFIKKRLIESILYRNLPEDILQPENKELKQYLIQKLRLPSVWIHSVLAHKCRFSGDSCGEFQNLIYCGRYCDAQNVAVDNIIPKLVINKNCDIAIELLGKLKPQCRLIDNYKYKAGLLLKVLKLIKTIEENRDVSMEQLMIYQEKLYSICKKIKAFEIKNVEQGLCIAEVSKCCAVFLYMIFKKYDIPTDVQLPHLNATCQKLLQMPPDYKATDLEVLSTHILDSFYASEDNQSS